MTPKQLRKALNDLYPDVESERGQAAALAVRLKAGLRTVQHWLSGDRAIPGPAEVAVRLLLELRKMADRVEGQTRPRSTRSQSGERRGLR